MIFVRLDTWSTIESFKSYWIILLWLKAFCTVSNTVNLPPTMISCVELLDAAPSLAVMMPLIMNWRSSFTWGFIFSAIKDLSGTIVWMCVMLVEGRGKNPIVLADYPWSFQYAKPFDFPLTLPGVGWARPLLRVYGCRIFLWINYILLKFNEPCDEWYQYVWMNM